LDGDGTGTALGDASSFAFSETSGTQDQGADALTIVGVSEHIPTEAEVVDTPPADAGGAPDAMVAFDDSAGAQGAVSPPDELLIG